ncbi:hypothetical protein CCR97_28160 [Rhodoplanes elegans]|uniref:Uncharacterized protein n=1 Tax=Rhodoplanes elegans TaxID=29408 RepID=A0A327KQ82_9BRAD|nr:hypothetical protein [Rhodoplanes elegans]MBK5962041.1 hypothetical protein [Rhodoplanes elegans]RAI40154.1 hypothetical protein CH338_07160 [Rhodoplanes elegans]
MKTKTTIAVGVTAVMSLAGLLASAPALAQIAAPSLDIGGKTRTLTSEEIEKQKAIDEAYSRTVKQMPASKPVVVDPWGNVRDAPSSATTPAQKPAPKAAAAKPQAAKPPAAKPAPAQPVGSSAAAGQPAR